MIPVGYIDLPTLNHGPHQINRTKSRPNPRPIFLSFFRAVMLPRNPNRRRDRKSLLTGSVLNDLLWSSITKENAVSASMCGCGGMSWIQIFI